MSLYRISSHWLVVGILAFISTIAHAQGLKGATERGADAPPSATNSLKAIISEGDESATFGTGIESLSLDKRAAQLMMVRLNGRLGPDNFDRQILTELPPGGVILPGISSPSTTISYVNTLRNFAIEKSNRIPFLIGADAFTQTDSTESDSDGAVSYLQLPSQMAIAAAGMSEATVSLMDDLSEHLNVLGINFHLGPSLSFSNKLNPALGNVNTFGDNPRLHAEISGVMHKSFREHDIAWLPLDFPGGAKNRAINAPPVLLTTMSNLRKNDLLPYVDAIERGVEFIHVGNILAPTLDSSGVPASLSATIMEQHLRRNFGFTGIIVSGPMDSRDLRTNIDPASAAVEAIRAGADMLLWESNSPHVVKAVVQIALAVRSGDLDEDLFNEKVERVLATKAKLGLLEREPPKDGKANSLLVGRKNWDSPVEIERRSITLLRNRGNILPLSNETSIPLGLTGTLPLDHVYDVLNKDIKQIGKQSIKTAAHIGRVEDFELDRLQRRVRGTRVTVCLFSNTTDARSQAEIVRVLRQGGSRVVVVSFGFPGDLAAYAAADAILVMYGTLVESKDPSEAVHALADVLLGRGTVEILPGIRPLRRKIQESIPFNIADVVRSPIGKLPISIPALFDVGDSVSYTADTSHLKVLWDFGDGARSKEHEVEHAYAEPGSYTVTLTIDPKVGKTVSGTYEIIAE